MLMYFIGRFLLLFFATGANGRRLVYAVSFIILYVGQALLTQRLTRKNYRAFRVYVLREDGRSTRRLAFFEAMRVCGSLFRNWR